MSGLVERKGSAVATVGALSSKLKPATDGEIREAVVRMLAAFSVGATQDKNHAEMLIKTYMAALSGLPLWAITGAAKSFLRGTVEEYNPNFRPTPPQWAREANKACDAVHSEIKWQQARIAPAPKPEIPEDQREAIAIKFKAMRESLASGEAKQQACADKWKSPDQIMAELEAMKDMPLQVSPRLKSLLQEQINDESQMRAIRERVAMANSGKDE